MPYKLKDLKIEEGSFVERGANPEAKVVFFKSDGGPRPGQSERDAVWESILAEFDVWQKDLHDRGYFADRAKGKEYTPKTREQLLTQFLGTPEGKRWYDRYTSASNDVVVAKAAENATVPRTLKEYGEDALDKIAKRWHAENPHLTYEGCYCRMLKDSAEAMRIYGFIDTAFPIATVNSSASVSKSKRDAIATIKKQIDAEVRKAERTPPRTYS